MKALLAAIVIMLTPFPQLTKKQKNRIFILREQMRRRLSLLTVICLMPLLVQGQMPTEDKAGMCLKCRESGFDECIMSPATTYNTVIYCEQLGTEPCIIGLVADKYNQTDSLNVSLCVINAKLGRGMNDIIGKGVKVISVATAPMKARRQLLHATTNGVLVSYTDETSTPSYRDSERADVIHFSSLSLDTVSDIEELSTSTSSQETTATASTTRPMELNTLSDYQADENQMFEEFSDTTSTISVQQTREFLSTENEMTVTKAVDFNGLTEKAYTATLKPIIQLKCYNCSSTSDNKCAYKPTQLIACKSTGIENASGCYSLYGVDSRTFVRGCSVDLPEEGLLYCERHMQLCLLCTKSLCNTHQIRHNSANVMLSTTWYEMLAIFTSIFIALLGSWQC